jgi:type II secretory pathway component PulF
MPRFSYEAMNADGRRIIDSSEAGTRDDLILSLQAKGLILVRWIDAGPSGKSLLKRSGRSLNSKELLMLTREMAHLMKSGLPMDRSLTIIIQTSEAKPLLAMAQYLKESLQGGKSLSDAMSAKTEDFSDLYINMVRVGEMGGILPQVMEKLAGFMERTEEIKKFIISSSIYPAILLAIGMVSVGVIMGVVVPRFAAIFQDLGQKIPASTQLLIHASQFLRTWWWGMLLGTGVITLGLWRYSATSHGKDRLDRIWIKLPMMGSLIMDIQVGRFTRTLGTLVQSGVPLLKGLSIVREVVNNVVVKKAAEQIYRQVKEGKRVSVLMKDQGIFPAMAVQMVALGEETGKIGEMLISVSDDLDARVQSKIKSLLALLEPVAILFMGLVIGGVVISMLTAIFGINDIEF